MTTNVFLFTFCNKIRSRHLYVSQQLLKVKNLAVNLEISLYSKQTLFAFIAILFGEKGIQCGAFLDEACVSHQINLAHLGGMILVFVYMSRKCLCKACWPCNNAYTMHHGFLETTWLFNVFGM